MGLAETAWRRIVVFFDDLSRMPSVSYPVVIFDDLSTIVSMAKPSPHNAAARRRALQAFIDRYEIEVQTWTKASGMSESVVRHFLAERSGSMSDRTYSRLAQGASLLPELQGRTVEPAELRGEAPAINMVPVASKVGAGEQVYPIDGDSPFEMVAAPPGIAAHEAIEVDGDSMRPMYGPKDTLFPTAQTTEFSRYLNKVVIVQVRGGPRLVKLLKRGSSKGRFDLESINPAHPVIQDQVLEWVAPIGAAVYRV